MSEMNDENVENQFAMYECEAFKIMPKYPLIVQGTMIDFLADSGATRSTVRLCDLPCKPELKDRVSGSICASGCTMYERYTKPLICETKTGKVLKHAFQFSKTCPVPILGRDLMCKLNLRLIADSSGVRVEEEGSEQWSCLHEEPQWVYEWHIINYDWAEMVCRKARECITCSGVEMMAPDELHCTSHVALQRDENYEKVWFEKDETETLNFDKMFWTDSVCALSACLTEAQSRQYQMTEQTVPHLSLSKARGQKWSEVGLFVKQCVDAEDWRETGPDLQHSESLKAFMMTFKCEVEVERVVKPILHDQTDWENQCMVNAGPSDIHPALAEVPSYVWAKHKYDVGLIKGCEPLVITPKSDYRPCQHQYPLKKEAIEGIRPVFESLLREGVIVPCSDSPVRTPIFPVKKIRDKGQPTEWRFVQDLQAVNAAPSVPNPYTILSQIPSDAKFFSVVDLANAFFSMPVAKETSRDEATCVADTVTLLKHLAEEGHKVSLSKLQFAKQQVIFLGHVITPNSKSLSDKRIQGIKDVPKPITRKQMLSFFGMCSYCRTFIPNYAILEQPLRSLTVGKGLKSTDKIEWTAEAEEAFVNMKIQLAQAPALGLPNGDRPLVQMVDEKNGFMTSVLLQQHHEDRLRPVAYFSSKLDPVAAGLPLCLRAVAAAEQAVIASREFVGYSDLTLMAPHAVTMILQEQKTLHLSTARWLRYHTILLDMPNITIKRCTTLNAATLLPTEGDGEEHHCCLTTLEQICTPRPDLSDMPLKNCDNVLFVDGSASKDPQTGQNKVGYVITTEFEVVASGKLPSNYSAQAAELVALTEACKLMKGQCVTIYTDSRYAFGVTHDFGALWKHRKFLKSDGRPILNAHLVAELLEAILLPEKIAICKCAAHTNQKDSVSLGNARADAAAKTAAAQQTEEPECTLLSDTNENSFSSLQGMQTFATGPEKEQWRKCGCKVTDGVWMSEDGRPCLPKHFFSHYCRLTHGPPHVGLEGGKQPLPSTELCEHDMLSYCKEMSSLLSNICVQVKELEGEKVAGTVPGASDHAHGCEGGRKSDVGARQSLQESSISIPGKGAGARTR
ncbi:Gag-pol polyprotein [Labeo rohita]|uniref:Gag-pol polyprotein n=1 Tax=Labeo rohita TaxID=84645 RepID=A0ABQ8N095_LABRO|nr:Gag-pol polyprotein [Labeo rohita]